jgi:hypothetical protein
MSRPRWPLPGRPDPRGRRRGRGVRGHLPGDGLDRCPHRLASARDPDRLAPAVQRLRHRGRLPGIVLYHLWVRGRRTAPAPSMDGVAVVVAVGARDWGPAHLSVPALPRWTAAISPVEAGGVGIRRGHRRRLRWDGPHARSTGGHAGHQSRRRPGCSRGARRRCGHGVLRAHGAGRRLGDLLARPVPPRRG